MEHSIYHAYYQHITSQLSGLGNSIGKGEEKRGAQVTSLSYTSSLKAEILEHVSAPMNRDDDGQLPEAYLHRTSG